MQSVQTSIILILIIVLYIQNLVFLKLEYFS
jgi:hypothetical protein